MVRRRRVRRDDRDDVRAEQRPRGLRPGQRGYDDGGLVDANTAPATVLARLPALGPVLAKRLVTVRDSAGGFSSAGAMAILADLPPSVVEQIRDQLVFSPR